MKTKQKITSKKFKFDENQLNYKIRLRKFNKLWLLLLLLPLLLLKFEKTIFVEVLSNDGNPISNAEVTFKYTPSYLYKEGDFFVRENYNKSLSTDTNGIVTFENLPYTVYSFIFYFNTTANITTIQTDCFDLDSIQNKFHTLRSSNTLKLTTPKVLIDINFKVIDKEDKQPLPDASVIMNYTYLGKKTIDSLKTNAQGMVTFNKIPKCSTFSIVTGKREGFENDSITNLDKDQILNNIDKRTLELDPINKKIIFFVTDCMTGEPLPNAKAVITLTSNLKKKTQTISTDLNGQGKGVYDKAHIISKISIDVTKKYYENGKLDKTYTVRDFVKLPDSLRTICLKPKENPITFLNTDAATNKPLPGVNNLIIIKRGKDVIKDNVMSNKNGIITIAEVFPGDIISIHATKLYYKDNDYTIKEALVIKLLEGALEGRIIPLDPLVAKLNFRVLDSHSKTLLPDVQLKVTNNNTLITPSLTKTGEFTVEAKYSSILSIVASKHGYKDNSIKINNDLVEFLAKSNQDKRDIYLGLLPCTDKTKSSSSDGLHNIFEYDMKQNGGSFVFEFNTQTIPDSFKIYCGRKNDITNKAPIFEFSGTTNSTWVSEKIPFNCRVITIVANASEDDSSFEYKVRCP